MFGYIRPEAGELKVKEFGRFRACYCGLCHELGRSYGFAARFILNYDFVFLAMLLWRGAPRYETRRCAVSPACGRCVCASSPALERCAGYSVILAYWKLCDSVADEGLFASLGARLKRFALLRPYRKAAARWPRFDETVKSKLTELNGLEKTGETSLDRAADKFASLLSAAAEDEPSADAQRAEAQLLYHAGRIIYIADAYQDLGEDMKRGRYNPIASRFGLRAPELSAEERETVRLSLENSLGLMASAFELMPSNYWSGALRNIICVGMPGMCRQVLCGTFENRREGAPRLRGRISAQQIGDEE